MKETPKELEKKIENKQIQAEMLIEMASNEIYNTVLDSTTDTFIKILDNGFLDKEEDINDQTVNPRDQKIRDLNNSNKIKVFLYSFVRLLDSTNVINVKEPAKVSKTAEEAAQEIFDGYFNAKRK